MTVLKPFFVIFCFLILFIADADAESYSSKTVPPEGIISKALNKSALGLRASLTFIKSIGKYQDKDGIYHYYYIASSQQVRGEIVLEVKLMKLDTDIWIAQFGNEPSFDILEK